MLSPPPCISVPQAVHASKAMPQQSLTCILTMSGSLSHCLSRCRRTELSESELEQDAVKYDKVVPVQLISQPLKKRSLLGSKHRLTMVNTPLNRALGVRNQIFHSNDTRSAVAWTWERMMSATCRRSSKSMLSQFPRWEDRYSIFCGETLSAFSAAISLISP